MIYNFRGQVTTPLTHMSFTYSTLSGRPLFSCAYAPHNQYIYHLVGFWIVSTSWLLWVGLQQIWGAGVSYCISVFLTTWFTAGRLDHVVAVSGSLRSSNIVSHNGYTSLDSYHLEQDG